MYRGNNRTACASQRQIAEALLELLAEGSYQSVSVTSICRRASVSRQTFYTLFESKENVIIYELSVSSPFQPDYGGADELTLRGLARSYSRYLTAHRQMLSILVQNGLIHYMYGQQYDALIHCARFMPKASPEERLFTADFIASGMTSIARSYILSGAKENERNLEEMICRLFSGRMIP